VDVDGTPLTVSVPDLDGGPVRPEPGAPVRLCWPREAMVALEPVA
jgi:hypothetical protein